MSPLRRRRLLLVAWYGGNCKAFYSQYLELMYNNDPSPVGWVIGHAYLTDAGMKELGVTKK